MAKNVVRTTHELQCVGSRATVAELRDMLEGLDDLATVNFRYTPPDRPFDPSIMTISVTSSRA